MTTYEIHVLTGDLSKPIKRVLKANEKDLVEYLQEFDTKRECSLITRELSLTKGVTTKGIFFGSKEALIKHISPRL